MKSASGEPFRLGVVRYLNTLPLIDGLERLESLELRHEVPARLIGLLDDGEVDMALCSSIDLLRSRRPVRIVPVGCLACHGETLTVRLFARRPLGEITVLDADAESHTSVVLAQVLLRELHGAAPSVRPFEDGRDDRHRAEALLLIGDKAVHHAPSPSEFPVCLDLGEAWRALTGLPFVFAAWMCPADRSEADEARRASVAAVLDHRRRANRPRLEAIATAHAAAHGFTVETARRYLGSLLDFDFTPRHAEGLALFLGKAQALGLAPTGRSMEIAAIPRRPAALAGAR